MDRFSFCIILLVLQLSVCQETTEPSSTADICGHFYSIKDTIRDLEIKIAQQNANIAQQNTKIAEENGKQDTLISQQAAKIAEQNAKLAEQNTKLLQQNVIIQDLKTTIQGYMTTTQPPIIENDAASIFTRWGRTDCPGGVSELVYSGLAGGSHNTHTGGAAEYVCLPPDPIWNSESKYYNGPQWGYMYGAEYETLPQPIQNYKVPCAVCRSNRYSTVLMIPATSQCYTGWTEAYHGELVSGHFGHHAPSQYVCLDGDPHTNGTRTNKEGKLMYPVRARCGSLPCPPYEDNTLLACVVCLK